MLRQVLRDWRFSGITTGRTGEPFSIEDSNLSSKLEGPRGGLETAYADCLANGALSAGPTRTISALVQYRRLCGATHRGIAQLRS